MLTKFFDKIVCINTTDAIDRRTKMKRLFRKHNIDAQFHVTDRQLNPIKGCFEAHINVIKQVHEEGCKNVLIFEDDVIEGELNDTILSKIIDFLKAESWDIFYFGAIPDMTYDNYIKKLGNGENIYQINSTGLCCYAMNNFCMSKYKNLKFDGDHIDFVIQHDDRLKCFVHYPTQFYQTSIFHDYIKSDKIISFIYKTLEYFAFNINLTYYDLYLLGFLPFLIIFLWVFGKLVL